MADNADVVRSADQLTEQPIGAQRSWLVFAVVEVLLCVLAVAFDVSLPTS
jgi:hypothetical protein